MRFERLSTLALAGLVLTLAVACSDAPQEPPSPRLPGAAADITIMSLATCDTKQVEQLGKDVFGPSDQTHRETIRTFTDAVKTGNTSTAQNLAFALIDDVPDAPGSDALKSEFTKHVLLCAGLLDSSTTDEQFGALSFQTALDLESFGVRGCSAESSDPVVAVNNVPVWVLDESVGDPGGGDTWCDIFGDRRLVWGEPDSDFTTAEVEIASASGFDWNAVPAGELSGKLAVIVCVDIQPGDEGWHLAHGIGGGVQILTYVDGTGRCPEPDTDLAEGGAGARLLHLARGFFGPRPLHADAAVAAGGLGGLAGALSPFVGVDPVAIQVSFPAGEDQPPARVDVTETFSATVLVTADGGTPMPDVEVVLTVQGNLGSFTLTGATNSHQSCVDNRCIARTDESGLVTFEDLKLDKPGGYTLLAEVELVEGTNIEGESDLTDSATSPMFHVNQNL